MSFIFADIFSDLGSNALLTSILLLAAGIALLGLVLNFLYQVPKSLKRIADALENGKIQKKKGDLSGRDDMSMFIK